MKFQKILNNALVVYQKILILRTVKKNLVLNYLVNNVPRKKRAGKMCQNLTYARGPDANQQGTGEIIKCRIIMLTHYGNSLQWLFQTNLKDN